MAYRTYSPANGFTVDKLGNGDFTTIGAAITAAVSGDTIFIRPGTYTENPALKAGVNLTAFGSDASSNATGVVVINGTCSFASAGTVTISGIMLQTNAANLLSVTGSAASNVNLNNCYLNCTNNTGISFTTGNVAASIRIINSAISLGTTGIAIYSMSSTGTLFMLNCIGTNSGSSTTISSNSAGATDLFYCDFPFAVGTTGTGGILLNLCYIELTSMNTTALTANGTGTSNVTQNYFGSGTASAVTVGTGATLPFENNTVSSSNTNAITGAGTLTYSGIGFINSKNINTTTQIGGTLAGGTFQAPSIGFLGEQIRNYGSAVSVTSTIPANITSISLTPGVWDISLVALGSFSGVSTGVLAGISTISATIAGNLADQYTETLFSSSGNITSVAVPSWRAVVTTTTTYFLVGQCNFSSGVASMYGRISATRVG